MIINIIYLYNSILAGVMGFFILCDLCRMRWNMMVVDTVIVFVSQLIIASLLILLWLSLALFSKVALRSVTLRLFMCNCASTNVLYVISYN